jgi:hypothetical protein
VKATVGIGQRRRRRRDTDRSRRFEASGFARSEHAAIEGWLTDADRLRAELRGLS